MGKTTYHRIAAVQKACEILATMGEAKEPLTGNEIAIRTGQAPGTTMCQLATLEDYGFVETVGDGYRLGFKFAIFWARKKAELTCERERIEKQLEQIGGNDEQA